MRERERERVKKKEEKKHEKNPKTFLSRNFPTKIQLSRFIVIIVCALVSITMFGHFHLSRMLHFMLLLLILLNLI